MKNAKRSLAALFALMLVLAAGCGKKVNDHVVDYKVDVPESFQETEQEGVTACWAGADNSNINVNITEKTGDFKKITAGMLKEALEVMFEQAYGAKPTITDKYFTSNEVCGLPAYQYCYVIELNGMEMTQLVVCVDADQTYTITYTDVTGDWMEDFEASAKNIQLITE